MTVASGCVYHVQTGLQDVPLRLLYARTRVPGFRLKQSPSPSTGGDKNGCFLLLARDQDSVQIASSLTTSGELEESELLVLINIALSRDARWRISLSCEANRSIQISGFRPMLKISALFWDITQRRMVMRFGRI
jgi:hypothetical protein